MEAQRITADELAIYDRQIRVWGFETQQRCGDPTRSHFALLYIRASTFFHSPSLPSPLVDRTRTVAPPVTIVADPADCATAPCASSI